MEKIEKLIEELLVTAHQTLETNRGYIKNMDGQREALVHSCLRYEGQITALESLKRRLSESDDDLNENFGNDEMDSGSSPE